MLGACERVTNGPEPFDNLCGQRWTAKEFPRFPYPCSYQNNRRHTRLKATITVAYALDNLVGARGFEPPTSRSRTVRSTRLSHAPTSEEKLWK